MTSKRPTADAARPLPPSVMQTFRDAMAAHQAGRFVEAEALYRRILSIDAKQFPVLSMLGVLQAQRGDYPEAERLLRDALQLNPNDASGQFNYGNVLLGLRRYDEALTAFEAALAANPKFAEAHLNCGSILMARKRFDEAIACFDAAIRINPSLGAAHCNRGSALEDLRRFEEALTNYDAALALNPRNAEYHASRANVLNRMRRRDEALSALSTAVALQPGNAGFHYNRGNILFELKRFAEAFEAYDQAVRLDPQLDYVEGDRFFAKRMICDWSNLAAENEHLVEGVSAGRAVSRPFAFLSVESSQVTQARCASLFADREFPALLPLCTREHYHHQRIRLAYLSADFRDHPVSYLLAGLFESHDRARFETMAVSFGTADPTPMRKRLEAAFDQFVDVRNESDAKIARMLREAEVDIAIDLMGPTQDARPAILSHRPAPIQAIYLGYAGSSGAPYVDYIFADRTVVLEREQDYFREKIIYLPDSFMGTDSKRAIAANTPSRADEGLPEAGFVFCAFSNSYKISPKIFDVWMELLREVDGSALWLSDCNDAAKQNLRREARSRGVDPERLVFARRVTLNQDHLARLRLADLFLDTLPLGAHSTVCDALWTGTPVLTCAGPTFGSRIAASLLSAAGLAELITGDLPAYREFALRLSRNPPMLASLKVKVAAHRDTFPLFDTKRFTRHIEAAYAAIWSRYQRGEPPESFAVETINLGAP